MIKGTLVQLSVKCVIWERQRRKLLLIKLTRFLVLGLEHYWSWQFEVRMEVGLCCFKHCLHSVPWIFIFFSHAIPWQGYTHKFEIAEDIFWKDGEPFRILGGDLHYFRVYPEVCFVSVIFLFLLSIQLSIVDIKHHMLVLAQLN